MSILKFLFSLPFSYSSFSPNQEKNGLEARHTFAAFRIEAQPCSDQFLLILHF